MNRMLDNGLVALVLLASLGYALLSLGPKAQVRRLRLALARLAASAPPQLHLGAIARRLQAAAAKGAGGCAGCENCEPEPASGVKPSEAGRRAADSRAAEVRVPLEKIGKRGQSASALRGQIGPQR
jgi:hypothetical protein